MDEHVCDVWIGGTSQLRPAHEELLDDDERARAHTCRRADDRSRFVLGAALLKLAVASRSGRPAASVRVDRRCPSCGAPHGRPSIGPGLHVSVSHSGAMAAIAITSAGPLGVDIESRSTRRVLPAPRQVLHPGEPLDGPWDLLTYWCRKESVVKATGEGLQVPFQDVVVSAARDPARLLEYRGTPLAAFMTDLGLGERYAGALTVLSSSHISVHVRSAASLLGG